MNKTVIKGCVKIEQRKRISLRSVISECICIDHETHIDSISMGDVKKLTFYSELSCDLETAMERMSKFKKELKFIKGSFDVEIKGFIKS